MPKREDIELRYRADISELVKKLGSIEGITAKEATAMAKALDRGFKKASRSAEKAARASRAAWKKTRAQMDSTSSTLDSVEDAAGDADSAIMGLSGAAGMLDDRLAGAATTAGDLGAAVESAIRIFKGGNPVLIAATAAVAAGGLAWSKYSEEAERSKAIIDASTEAMRLNREWSLNLADAQRSLAVTMGEMTREEAGLASTRTDINQALLADMQAITPQITQQQEAVNKARTAWEMSLIPIGKVADLSDREREQKAQLISAWKTQAGIAEAAYNKERDLLDDLMAKRDRIGEAGKGIVESYQAELVTARLIADAESANAQIEQDRIDKEERARAAAVEAQLQAERAAEASRELDLIRRESLGEITEAEAALVRTMDAEIANVIRLGEESGRRAEAEAEALQIAMDAESAIGELREQNAAKELEAARALQAAHDERVASRREMETAAHDERMAQIEAEALAVANSTADVLGSMGDLAALTSENAETQAEEAQARADELREKGMTEEAAAAEREAALFRDAANDAFRRSQQLAAASVVMDTASGVVKALSDHAGNPIVGMALAASMVAAGGVQLATINAQSPAFDIGGIVGGNAIDSQPARLRSGEGVLTAQGVQAIGGPGAIHAANRGQGSSPAVVAVSTFEHWRPHLSRELSRPGQLRRAMIDAASRSNLPGQRGY